MTKDYTLISQKVYPTHWAANFCNKISEFALPIFCLVLGMRHLDTQLLLDNPIILKLNQQLEKVNYFHETEHKRIFFF